MHNKIMKINLNQLVFVNCLSLILSCGNVLKRLLKFNSTENLNSLDPNESQPVSEGKEINSHFKKLKYIWNISYAPYQVECPSFALVRVAAQV